MIRMCIGQASAGGFGAVAAVRKFFVTHCSKELFRPNAILRMRPLAPIRKTMSQCKFVRGEDSHVSNVCVAASLIHSSNLMTYWYPSFVSNFLAAAAEMVWKASELVSPVSAFASASCLVL